MIVEVDFNPSPSDQFFISVGLNDREAISFDNTTKGRRITKQLLRKVDWDRTALEGETISGEWEAIFLENGKFVDKFKIRWIDKGVIDIINLAHWEVVWQVPMSDEIASKMKSYSHFVSDHYSELKNYKNRMSEMDQMLEQELQKVKELLLQTSV